MIRSLLLWLAVAGIVLAVGCSTAPKTEIERADLRSDAASTIAKARQTDPSLEPFFRNSVGYVVFPAIGKGGAGIGGAYGRGVLYEAGRPTSYVDVTQATIGLQLGGQKYSELIFFERPETLNQFKGGNFTFAAQATAVALESGAGANADYKDGVAVFTMGEAGLMAEASVGGQKFSIVPMEGTVASEDWDD